MTRVETVADLRDEAAREMTPDECFIEAFRPSRMNGSIQKLAEEEPKESGSWQGNKAPSWYVKRLVEKYDRQWFEWEPETLWATIKKDFGTDLSELVRNKVNAAKLIYLTDSFWKDWNVFEKVVQAFSDHIPDFFTIEPPSPGEMAWAVGEASYMRPSVPFSEEVAAYTMAACKDAGLVLFPEELGFAQQQPLGSLAKDVKAAWNMIKDLEEIEIQESEIGVNLVRLQAIQVYVEERSDDR